MPANYLPAPRPPSDPHTLTIGEDSLALGDLTVTEAELSIWLSLIRRLKALARVEQRSTPPPAA